MALIDRLKRLFTSPAGLETFNSGKPKSTFLYPNISSQSPASGNPPSGGKNGHNISASVRETVPDPAINRNDPPPPYSRAGGVEQHAEAPVMSRQFLPFSSDMTYEQANEHAKLEAKHAEAANYTAPPSPRRMDERVRDGR